MEEVSDVLDFIQFTPYGDDAHNENNNTNNNPRVVVLASTYGEGEPTDNAAVIVNACKVALEEQDNNNQATSPLKSLEYTVFGLGNREYELFNAMGKFFDATLEQLGGTRVHDMGLGDDNDDLEADFEKWKDLLWTALKRRYNVDDDRTTTAAVIDDNAVPDCTYSIVWHSNDSDSEGKTNNRNQPLLEQVHGSSRHYFTAIDCPVSAVRELRSSIADDGGGGAAAGGVSDGSTVHVELDISKLHTELRYETADNLGVLPCNDPAIVESVAQSLGYDLDATFSVRPPANGTHHEWHGDPFPMPLTVRECLTRYLDLTSAPRRSDLKLLSWYAKDAVDRRALQRLSSKEGKQQYKEKITDSYVGLVDLLKLCPSIGMPLEHLIQWCHFTLPRFYTISSCPRVYPDSIHLTVAVTREQREDGTLFEGVCSTHIAKSQLQKLRVFVRTSTFRLPKDVSKPIIMIGPGTGIAPMRALLQERRHQQLVEKKKEVGSNILYFGCQRKEVDYLYEDELRRYQEDGVLTELHVAFSREDPGGKKVYVQHLLKEQGASTWKLLDGDGAYIYVCGGVKMGHDVTETLKEIVSTQGQMSFDQAGSYLSQLSSQGRYVQELWS
jgi:NADPH-ferrihemoprotein reductase